MNPLALLNSNGPLQIQYKETQTNIVANIHSWLLEQKLNIAPNLTADFFKKLSFARGKWYGRTVKKRTSLLRLIVSKIRYNS